MAPPGDLRDSTSSSIPHEKVQYLDAAFPNDPFLFSDNLGFAKAVELCGGPTKSSRISK